MGLSNGFGRSILVTASPFEAEVWLTHFVDSDFAEVVPTLNKAPLENHVVHLLAPGLARSREELRDLLLSSFTGVTHWTLEMSRDEFLAALDSAVRLCVEGGLVTEGATGELTVTALGHACAAKGIGVDTTIDFARWARESRTAAISDVEVLTVVSLSPAGREVYVNMVRDEQCRDDYRGGLLRRAAEAGVADRPVFGRLATSQDALDYETAKALKKALFLGDWINEVLDALPLARLRVRGLGRAIIRRLVAAGLADADSLTAAGPEAVRKTVGHRSAFAALWTKLTKGEEPPAPPRYPDAPTAELPMAAEPAVAYGANDAPAPPSPAVLVVNLRERKVAYRGHEIRTKPPDNLQRQPLLALAVLAGRPGEVMTMAELAEGMFKLGGLGKRPVAPDAKDLRYKLLRPFKKALNGSAVAGELDNLIESVPGVGLRLNCTTKVTSSSS